MHVTCPQCQSVYDIDVSLIPENGRKVKCGECSNLWTVNKPLKVNESAKPEVESSAVKKNVPARNDKKSVQKKSRAKEGKVETKVQNAVEKLAERTTAARAKKHVERDEEVKSNGSKVSEGSLSEKTAKQAPAKKAKTEVISKEIREKTDIERSASSTQSDQAETASPSIENPKNKTQIFKKAVKAEVEEPKTRVDRDSSQQKFNKMGLNETDAQLSEVPAAPSLIETKPVQSEITSVNEAVQKKRTLGSVFWSCLASISVLCLILLLIRIGADKISESIPSIESALTAYSDYFDMVVATISTMVQGVVEQVKQIFFS